MRWLPALALFLGLSGSAQAFTLFDVEPNDCFCEATPGGNAQTTAISGFLSDFDEDYYRFEFSAPVAFLSLTPSSPSIAGDDSFRVFDLGLFIEVGEGEDSFFDLIAVCEDCWYMASALEAYDLPAGTYYVGVADFGGVISGLANNEEPLPGNEEPPPSRGLGAYTLTVATTVPEPASLALFATAVAGLALRRRR